MFKTTLVTVSLIFFLLINTIYFWEGMLGFFAMPMAVVLAIVFLILLFNVLRQVYILIKDRFRDRQRFYSTLIVLILLILIAVRPFGVINYSAFESESILVAEREGVANCTTTLILKEGGRFRIRSVCFGVDEETGIYIIKKDTVKLNYTATGRVKKFQFGILDTAKKSLTLYRSFKDTLTYPLYISKYQLQPH